MNTKLQFKKETLIPLVFTIITLALHILVPNSKKDITKPLPYFTELLIALIILFIILIIVSLFNEKIRNGLAHKSKFVGAVFIFLAVLDLITAKFQLIPPLYFPSIDKILAVFVTDWWLLLKCIFYSSRLLVAGFFIGAIVGLITGIGVGWSEKCSYWVNPLVKFVGPIPSTAWIPVALVAFPNSFIASIFIIALGVWFPTTVLTSSGISNVKKSYFEVSSTLGASEVQNIFKIAIPSAMPSMFIGLFNGIGASFLTLVTAEMIGVKFGIGWYINWQRELMAYANVYAGLLVIAVSFSLIITGIFKIRNRVLGWQKGVIKW